MHPDRNGFSSADEFTPEHAERMLDLYCSKLEQLGYEAIAYPNLYERLGANIYAGAKYDALCHAKWMCGEARRFVRANRYAKAYRWIGMIQGLLFMGGVYSIYELKAHNAPDQDNAAEA